MNQSPKVIYLDFVASSKLLSNHWFLRPDVVREPLTKRSLFNSNTMPQRQSLGYLTWGQSVTEDSVLCWVSSNPKENKLHRHPQSGQESRQRKALALGTGCEPALGINEIAAVLLVLVQGKRWAYCDIIQKLEKKSLNMFWTCIKTRPKGVNVFSYPCTT